MDTGRKFPAVIGVPCREETQSAAGHGGAAGGRPACGGLGAGAARAAFSGEPPGLSGAVALPPGDKSGEPGQGARPPSCREACGACCIAPSISSPIPAPAGGYPPGYTPLPGGGKPAGVACPQLSAELRCLLFGRPERPAVCSSLRPSESMCGSSREEALGILALLERATAPGGAS